MICSQQGRSLIKIQLERVSESFMVKVEFSRSERSTNLFKGLNELQWLRPFVQKLSLI
jgi:hypothetical protein